MYNHLLLAYLLTTTTQISQGWLATVIFTSLHFYSFGYAVILWHRKCIGADVIAALVNSRHSVDKIF